MIVERALEVRHLQGVVRLNVDTEVLDLLEGDGLVLRRALFRRLVVLGVRAERTELHLAAVDGALGVNLRIASEM